MGYLILNQTTETMKTAIISCLIASAVAFAPLNTQRASVSLNAAATADSYTVDEKEKMVNSCFQAHGFFPDVREEDELSADVRKMRQYSALGEKKLKGIKAKYAGMSTEDECYNILIDLGLMEDYSKMGQVEAPVAAEE